MNLSPLHIWATMGLMSKIIASTLLVMAVACIAVTVERVIALLRGESENRAFARGAAPLMEVWDHEQLTTLADKHPAAPLARLVGPGQDRLSTGQVVVSLLGFTLLYGTLGVVDIYLLTKHAKKGPDAPARS